MLRQSGLTRARRNSAYQAPLLPLVWNTIWSARCVLGEGGEA
jgi:hypothetical protein